MGVGGCVCACVSVWSCVRGRVCACVRVCVCVCVHIYVTNDYLLTGYTDLSSCEANDCCWDPVVSGTKQTKTNTVM